MRLVLAYARERLLTGPVLAAICLVVLAVLAGRGWAGGSALAVDAGIALALVVSYRVTDDIVDRERDRVKHPSRVAVRATSVAPLRFTAVLLSIASFMSLWRVRGPASFVLVAAYSVILAASYAPRRRRSAATDRVLLLKYGVFTLALIGVPDMLTARGLLSAASAFAIACVYEWWHDDESPVFSFGGSR